MTSTDHHDHRAGSHSYAPGAGSDRRYLLIALALLVAFMLGEVIAAVISGSLALLSDAGHMLADVGALAGALWAIRLAARPPSGAWTFGWKRAEILSAAVNGITLLVVSGIVAVEAITRLIHPPRVDGGPVVVVATVGIAVNITAAWVLARANRSSLNVQGAFRHVLTDLYGFIGTVIAGVIILATGFTRADAIASLLVVGLIVASLLNLFLHSSGLQFGISILAVVIFAGLTAWDTQAIKEMYYAGDGYEMVHKKSINGALRLYLDFINMFQALLMLTGSQRNN